MRIISGGQIGVDRAALDAAIVRHCEPEGRGNPGKIESTFRVEQEIHIKKLK